MVSSLTKDYIRRRIKRNLEHKILSFIYTLTITIIGNLRNLIRSYLTGLTTFFFILRWCIKWRGEMVCC